MPLVQRFFFFFLIFLFFWGEDLEILIFFFFGLFYFGNEQNETKNKHENAPIMKFIDQKKILLNNLWNWT